MAAKILKMVEQLKKALKERTQEINKISKRLKKSKWRIKMSDKIKIAVIKNG